MISITFPYQHKTFGTEWNIADLSAWKQKIIPSIVRIEIFVGINTVGLTVACKGKEIWIFIIHYLLGKLQIVSLRLANLWGLRLFIFIVGFLWKRIQSNSVYNVYICKKYRRQLKGYRAHLRPTNRQSDKISQYFDI